MRLPPPVSWTPAIGWRTSKEQNKRRTLAGQSKAEVVRLVPMSGKTIAKIAREIDLDAHSGVVSTGRNR